MKRFAILLLMFVGFSCVAQTNYFWSATYTSNYFRTNIVAYVDAALATNNLARTNTAIFTNLSLGITTNLPTISGTNGAGVYMTNWFCITNGLLIRITNNVP